MSPKGADGSTLIDWRMCLFLLRNRGLRRRVVVPLGIIVISLVLSVCTALAQTDRIWVNAEIDGVALRLVLDTGSSVTAVWSKTVKERGLRTVPQRSVVQGTLTFMGKVVRSPVYVINANMFDGKTVGEGVLGWPAIKGRPLQFD